MAQLRENEIAIQDGFDNEGDEYEDVEEFWSLIDERDWYITLNLYWHNKKANIDDMLGGMTDQIHKIDIETSIQITKKYWPKQTKNKNTYALDCGAGIGRVTEYVLGKTFTKVDLVEINPNFCKCCIQRIGNKKYFGKIIAKSLHKFKPKSNYYNCIWCQWTLEHLTDDDLIKFLINCKKALNKSSKYSYCVFKENVCRNNLFYVNIEGSSIIRHQSVLINMFKKAKLNVVQIMDQKGFPKDLWPQKIFILN
eukprot:95350_1